MFISRQSIPEEVTCPLMTGEEEALNGESRKSNGRKSEGGQKEKAEKKGEIGIQTYAIYSLYTIRNSETTSTCTYTPQWCCIYHCAL